MASQKITLVVAAAVALLLAAIAYYSREHFSQALITQTIIALGLYAIPIFIVAYAAAVVSFLPATLISIAAGAVFGPLWGTVYSVLGATLGSSLAFLLSRYLLSGWIREKGGKHTKKMMHCVETEAWRFVAFVRLVPLFPFNLSNYLFGITSLPLFSFVWPTALFIIPGTLARTYIGHVGIETLQEGGNRLVLQIGIVAALFGVVAFLPSIIKTVRAELKGDFN